jgi:superfamily II DNA/RNA helicase
MNALPENILTGCQKNGVTEFTALQKTIMGDLCLGSDVCVVSPAGTGKTLAVIFAALYRLGVLPEPSHVLIITGNGIHSEDIGQKLTVLGAHVEGLHVYVRNRRSNFLHVRDCERGRNIFVCTPGTAIDFLERCSGAEVITRNFASIFLIDADSTLGTLQSFEKIKKTMAYIPKRTHRAILTNSLSDAVKANAKTIVGPTPKRHLSPHKNLVHWFIYCSNAAQRLAMLQELLKVNPFKQGIIFCTGPNSSGVVHRALASKLQLNCAILSSDSFAEARRAIEHFNKSDVAYIIAHEYSPVQLLCQLDCRLVINYDIRVAGTYLKRVSVTGVVKKKVHAISIIDDTQAEFFEQVEKVCKVQLSELPETVAEVLMDDTPLPIPK